MKGKSQSPTKRNVDGNGACLQGPVNMTREIISEVPGLLERLNQLDGRIVDLDSLIGALEGRLHAVLTPEPAALTGRIQEEMPDCCEASQHIIGLTTQVESLQDRIRNLLGALEL